jgi:hypothetical protein
VVSNGKIGFGITAVDYDNDSGNRNGFISYKPIWMETNFGYQLDTYSLMKCDI